MKKQTEFINYAEKFAWDNKTLIILGGSFSKGTATEFSDIDIYINTDNPSVVYNFIYGYGQPIYISQTVNPKGILIVIYENGVALDLEIVKCDIQSEKLFLLKNSNMKMDINEDIAETFVLSQDKMYSVARLFHRSIIKYLSGKEETGISVLKEISGIINTVYEENKNYIFNYGTVLKDFEKISLLPQEYKNLLESLKNALIVKYTD